MQLWRYGQPIEKLGQRYRLDGMLGSGGMADVCLAWDEREQREVAIKVIKSDSIESEIVNRFLNEGSLVVGWQHPHIVRVYEQVRLEVVNSAQGSMVPYFVTEYVRGGTLQQRLRADLPYPFANTLVIFGQLCEAIQYAHEHNVIHRDLKPSNILFRSRSGPSEQIVLSDFGMAVSTDATHHTFPKGGTPLFMAPEQREGKAQVASDIFALGVILYRMCTGQMPFKETDLAISPLSIPTLPSTIHTALPKELDAVILQALAEEPARRYTSAALFWQSLSNALHKKDSIATPEYRTGPQPIINKSEGGAKNVGIQQAPPIVTLQPAQAAPPPHTNVEAANANKQDNVEPEKNTNGSTPSSVDDEIVEEKLKHSNLTVKPEAVTPNGPITPPPVNRRTTPKQQPALVNRRDSRRRTGSGLAAGTAGTAANGTASGAPATTRKPAGSSPVRGIPAGYTPAYRPPQRRWRLLLFLILLTVFLLCVAVAYAQPGLLGGLGKSLPGIGDSPATLTIQPDSQIVSNSYIVTGTEGTPNPKSQIIKARILNSNESSQTLLVKATGHNKIPGIAAKGFLTFFNSNTNAQSIAPTTFTSSTGVKVRNNAAVTIPAGDPVNPSSVQVATTALTLGTQGNIPAKAITGGCCTPGVAVQNLTAFTGGQDPVDYDFMTQGDVDKIATQQVQQQVVQDANKQLTNKMKAGEKLAENPQCTKNVNSSAPVGDTGKAVESTNVTVTASCSSVAYDDKGMRDLVTDRLKKKAQASPGEGYTLQDNRVVIDSKIQSVRPINLNVTAKGQWVYQFNDVQKQELLNKVKGLSVSAGRTTLTNQKGVKDADIQYVGGSILPTDVGLMNIIIKNPTALKDVNGNGPDPSPTVTGSTPVNSPGNEGTPGVGKG